MARHYLIIDGPNLLFAAHSSAKLHVGANEVQGIYGFIRTLRKLIETYPQAEPLVLWDGASFRKSIYPDYKANRDKAETAAEIKKVADKAAMRTQMKPLKLALKLLGVPQIICMNYEADDLAGILVERAEKRGDKVLLVTADEDWIQLVGPNVTWFDKIHDKRVTPANLLENYGVDTPEKFLELKALKGDMGDNLPGVGGIGPKGAAELLTTYQSIKNLLNLMVERALPAKMPKKIEDFLRSDEKQNTFYLNMRLMQLRSGPHRPAPVQMIVTSEAPRPEAFKTFCDRLLFRRFTTSFDEWIHPFLRTASRTGAPT